MSRLLITFPVYNESYILEQSLRTLYGWCNEHLIDFDWQILIADNGSTDSTLARAEAAAKVFPRVSFFHTEEKGRGQILRRAWLEREADFYTYMDVDLAVELDDYRILINSLIKGNDIAIGSRLISGAIVKRSVLRDITSIVYNFLVHLILGLRTRDTQCGFKGISRKIRDEILPQTEDSGWFWDTELLTLAEHNKYRVEEIPVHWMETRTAGRKSKVAIMRTILNYIINLIKLRLKLGFFINKNILGAALVFIISFGISVFFADRALLIRYYDQGNFLLAAQLIGEGKIPHSDFAVGHLMFYPWILNWIYQVGGFVVTRYFHFAVTAAALSLLWLLFSRYVSRRILAIIFLLFIFSPYWLLNSGLVLLDHASLFFFSAALLIIDRIRTVRGALLGGLLIGAAVISKITFGIVVLAAGISILLIARDWLRRRESRLILFGALLPPLVYGLVLGFSKVYYDVFIFHLSDQTVQSWSFKTLLLIHESLLLFPLSLLIIVGVYLAIKYSNQFSRVVASSLIVFAGLWISMRDIELHHTLTLTPFLLFIIFFLVSYVPRHLIWKGLFVVAVLELIMIPVSLPLLLSNQSSRKELVSFLSTIQEPIFSMTPFWVLQAGARVESWDYMAASDMANKRKMSSEKWSIIIQESPVVLIDRRARLELPPCVLSELINNGQVIFENRDFQVFKNFLIENRYNRAKCLK